VVQNALVKSKRVFFCAQTHTSNARRVRTQTRHTRVFVSILESGVHILDASAVKDSMDSQVLWDF